jgi:type III pantothenate kinase
MNFIIDNGNTFLKIGLFEQGQFVLSASYLHSESDKLLNDIRSYSIDAGILSSVAELPKNIEKYFNNLPLNMILDAETAIPIQNNYLSPQTLGSDRLANAVGAWELFKGESILVIDTGTCLKFDFIDQMGIYQGGAISPGLSMRYNALNHFTDRLPLLSPIENADLIGHDTNGSIHSGIINGMGGEIVSIIHEYQTNFPSLRIILTGGDARYFLNKLKTYIFASPTLTLQGLDSILRYNQ